jgi:hypothetical protein
MKINKFFMAVAICVFAFLQLAPETHAQGSKLTRQEKKDARRAIMNANFYILDSLFQARSFVLEADFLMDKYGQRVSVVSTVNFIKVDESKGILQTGSSSIYGYNGVGGVTAEGNVGSWDVHKDFKRLTYLVKFNLMTNVGVFDVAMNVTSDNYASATITGLGPGRLTWQGHIATVGNSRVFKGQNTLR